MQLKKNIKAGNKLILFLFVYLLSIFVTFKISAEISVDGNNTDIKILDKISSKNELIKFFEIIFIYPAKIISETLLFFSSLIIFCSEFRILLLISKYFIEFSFAYFIP